MSPECWRESNCWTGEHLYWRVLTWRLLFSCKLQVTFTFPPVFSHFHFSCLSATSLHCTCTCKILCFAFTAENSCSLFFTWQVVGDIHNWSGCGYLAGRCFQAPSRCLSCNPPLSIAEWLRITCFATYWCIRQSIGVISTTKYFFIQIIFQN